MNNRLRLLVLSFVLLLAGMQSYAVEKIPSRPSPPRLVNDMANMLTEGEQNQLESKLLEFERTTTTQITIVTVDNLGNYDVSDFAIKLGKEWGVGQSGRNNGVVILASMQDHKINISTGKGLEGALTDLTCGRIIRNEMVPNFKNKDFYHGFSKAADAVIAATKGEYKADGHAKQKRVPATAIILGVIFLIFILRMFKGGGGGGGNYMSGRGIGNFATGMIIGNLLSGGRGGGGGWGGGDSGGGGFGGFGGGDFGGGGASGSW